MRQSTRVPGEVLEVTQSCAVGDCKERCVVLSVEGPYMTLAFPNRDKHRLVQCGSDYLYVRVV